MTVPALPLPSRPDATVRVLVTELGERVGTETAAGWCVDLLSGADPHDYLAMLGYLGSNSRRAAFDPSWHDYWVRTWGARGLLYVWADSAAPVVVQGLGDEHWRPAEMCLKVSTLRQVGESGPGAVALVDHELPRVRQQAVRCLGANGDTEHVVIVEQALSDEHRDVRRVAARALVLLGDRLDLDIDVPDLG